MALKVWDNSTWAMASQIKVWDGNAWQEGSNANVHIWTGTSWQKIHPGVNLNTSISVSALDLSGSGPPPSQAVAELTLFANGKIQSFTSTSFGGTTLVTNNDWLLTGTNAEYDVYVTNFSGDTLDVSEPTDGTRRVLSTDRTYRLVSDYPDGVKSAFFDLNICSNTGSGTIIKTASVTIIAEAS
jgi:hypothetical protein